MELVVYLKNKSDLALVESLLKRLKLRFEKRPKKTMPPKPNQDLEKNLLELRHLAAQIQESSFGDPLEWQRQIRQDRPLPFREA